MRSKENSRALAAVGRRARNGMMGITVFGAQWAVYGVTHAPRQWGPVRLCRLQPPDISPLLHQFT